MQLLAIFALTELDELTAELCELESKAPVMRVEDDPADRRPFQEQVKAAAAAQGHEIAEWDRSQLTA
jgi:hypothetical protein